MTARGSTDVLVVGGGPAGASTAIRLAKAGHSVTMLERRLGPPSLTRGDVLDPSARRELAALDVEPVAHGAHEIGGMHAWFGDRSVPVPWPTGGRWSDATGALSHGVVWKRPALNEALREEAARVGVQVLRGHEATSPIVERGFVRGATVSIDGGPQTDFPCRFLVVADGANSRFGRILGTTRERAWPYAVSASTYFESPRSTDSWVDLVYGLSDRNGHPITGHGWINPAGDGTVNVGITVLSSYRDILGVNALKLLDSFIESVAGRWEFDPTARLSDPVRWRTPLGGSIRPIMGPTFLVAGDAAGMANPFNGHGVGSALMTGRIAAEVLDEALTAGNSTTLQRYPALLDAEIGAYHKVGRLAARFLGRPWLLRLVLRIGIRSEAAMGAALRISSNELRADRGGAEKAYALARVISRFAPSW